MKNPPVIADVIPYAFSIDKDTEPTVQEAKNGNIYLVRVDGITKPALRPISEVRDGIVKTLAAQRRRKAAETQAAALAEKIKGGEKMADIARGPDWVYKVLPAETRLKLSRNPAIGIELRDAIFKTDRDGVVTGQNRNLNAVTIAKVQQIKAVDPDKNKGVEKRIAQVLDQSVASDVEQEFRQALERQYKTEIDQHVIGTLLQSDQQ